MGYVSKSRSKRVPWKRLELKLNFHEYLSVVIILFSLLIELSLKSTELPSTFLSSFLIEKNLVLMEGSGSFQCFVHVSCHLPTKVPFAMCGSRLCTPGKFLLYFEAVRLFPSGLFLKMYYMFLTSCRWHVKFQLELLQLPFFKLWIFRLRIFTQLGNLFVL